MPVQTIINRAGQFAATAGEVLQKLSSTSAINKEASTNIGAGLGVKPGTNEGECLLPSANNSLLKGIVLRNSVYAPGSFGSVDQVSTPPGYIPGTELELLTEGECYVEIDADTVGNIVPGSTRAYLRFESDGGSNTKVGTFRHTDDGHTTDTTKQVLFTSVAFKSSDWLDNATGSYIARAWVSVSNKP